MMNKAFYASIDDAREGKVIGSPDTQRSLEISLKGALQAKPVSAPTPETVDRSRERLRRLFEKHVDVTTRTFK